MEIKRFVIVGAGAVGGTIGGLLAQQGYSVALIARGQHGQVISESGLTLHTPHRSTCIELPCFSSIEQVDWKQGDLAIISTKLNDAERAFTSLVKSAGEQLPVVCATNGIHGEIWAAKQFRHVISMMIWMPATFLHPGEVTVYGDQIPGVLDCGQAGKPSDLHASITNSLCKHLSASGFASRSLEDISQWKRAKLITNLANTAQALVEDDWKRVAKAAQREGRNILQLAGLKHVSTEQLRLRTDCVKLLPVKGEKRLGGSTWQSLQRGRPLESPWLEGAIVELAHQCNASAPINLALTDAAKTLTKLQAAKLLD